MKPRRPPYILYSLLGVAVIGLGGLGYLSVTQAQKVSMLIEERQFFLTESNSANQELVLASSTITALETELLSLRDELEDLADDYRDERNRNEEFEDQLRNLAGTIGDLDKLSKTDEELLQKYSKVYFLNENYIPERLRQLDTKYVLAGKGDQYFHANATEQLEAMIDAANRAGHEIKIVSAYRSFETQTELKGQFTQVYGSGANTFSADQGYSEHQLGTAVDITTSAVGGTFTSFAETEAYAWLLTNAHRFGFVLSYPEGNQFYIFEPWHWRFVGEDLARDLDRANAHFYDWEQRELDKYLLTIFD
jgi:D-alanyl-D-alanine carboxypeptidase